MRMEIKIMNILYLIVDKKSSNIVSERQKTAIIYENDIGAIRGCVNLMMSVPNYYHFAEDFELFRVADIETLMSHKHYDIASIGTFADFKRDYLSVVDSYRNHLEGDEDEV